MFKSGIVTCSAAAKLECYKCKGMRERITQTADTLWPRMRHRAPAQCRTYAHTFRRRVKARSGCFLKEKPSCS